MPKKIIKYQCDYCRKSYMRNSATLGHEEACFKNPNRTPRNGELAVWETLPAALMQDESYNVPGSDFLDTMDSPFPENIPQAAWWPMDKDGEIDLGYVWNNGKWNKIDGYVWPTLAPGFSFTDEIIPGINNLINQ